MATPGSTTLDAPKAIVHPDFDAPDADVSILSGDGKLFRIHSANMKVNSYAFQMDSMAPTDEPATFSENADVLELLFPYLYSTTPVSPKILHYVAFDLLLDIGRAAHKYQMAPGMIACDHHIITRCLIRNHIWSEVNCLKALEYATQYLTDVPDYMDALAGLTMAMDVTVVAKTLSDENFKAWVSLRDTWMSYINFSEGNVPVTNFFQLQVAVENDALNSPKVVHQFYEHLIRLRLDAN